MIDFLIPNAFAQTAGPAPAGFMELLPLVALFVVFYLFLIRPQMKRAKEHKAMVEAMSKGDEIVTNGGLLGKITELGENFVVVEISKGIEVKVQRHAVAATLPKGTTKTL